MNENNDFIGVYNNVFPEGYCAHMIEQFDIMQEKGVGSNRWQSERVPETKKNDYQIMASLKGHDFERYQERNPVDFFFEGLQSCFDEYTKKYSVLMHDKILCTSVKMQKTEPGGGYHVWHAEHGSSGESVNRVLVYMLYLNSLTPEEGGETEFLYQRKRFTPTENQIIIWPAAFTHTHRGNTVLGNKSKYVITGWFLYA